MNDRPQAATGPAPEDPAAATNPLDAPRVYELMVRSIADYAIYMVDADGLVQTWNAGAERTKGYRSDEMIGQPDARMRTDDDRQAGLPAIEMERAQAEGRSESEGWHQRKDGSRFWAQVVVQPIYESHGGLLGFAKVTRDCTTQRIHGQALAETTRNLDLALDNMHQGICLFDTRARLLLSNGRFCEILGIPMEALPRGTRFRQVLMLGLLAARRSVVAETPPAGDRPDFLPTRVQPLSGRRRVRELLNAEFPHLGRIVAVSTRLLDQGGWVSTLEDVTERRENEKRIEYLAHHDALTGLPNRFDFLERLGRLLDPPRDRRCFALLYLDLDRFKAVNDTMGHHVGDQLLRRVAARLRPITREGSRLSRLGGDEFTVVLPGCSRLEDAQAVAQRCIEELTRPFDIMSNEVTVGVSIGIVMVGPQSERLDADLAIQHADQALYKAKREGRNCHRVYTPGINDPMRARNELERDLRRAFAHDELQLCYQPIVDAMTGATSACEALLRWRTATRGHMLPAEFIPIAEERGLMPDIGTWVLRRACADAATWPAHIRVTVNVTPSQLAGEGFLRTLAQTLAESHMPPSRLELEITETTLLDHSEVPRRVLKAVRAMGIGVAMDDFGVGYSSLRLLQDFPFTRIKLDRSFVQGIGRNPRSIAIVRSVTGLCESLDIPMIAAGVETEEQRQTLRNERCGELQGFLISAPLKSPDLLQWLMDSEDVLSSTAA